jgi:hypothetical protein
VTELADMFQAQPVPQAPIVHATVAEDVASVQADVLVTVASFDGSRVQWGPCEWAPRTASALPERGDPCVVLFDERETPFVILTRAFA